MKKKSLVLIAALLSSIWDIRAENTQREIDSIQILLHKAHNDTVRVNLLNELTASFINMDRYSEAITSSNQAKRLSDSIGYKPGVALATRRMGVIYTQQADYPKAMECLLNALRMDESLNTSQELFMVNNNIGAVYYFQKNYSDALKHFIKANEIKKNDPYTLGWIGVIYLEMKRFDMSLEFLNQALSLSKSKNDIGGKLSLIGTVYEFKEEMDKALEYYFQSLKIKEEVDDYSGMCDVLGSIGDVYFKQKKYQESIKYETKSLEIAKKFHILYSIQETENVLSNIYESIGSKEKAYEHYKNYIAVRDSLYNEEQTKKTVRAEMNFDFEKKEAIANAIHDGEMKRQTMQRNGFITGFILVLIFSFFIFRGYRKTKRQNKIIEEQKHLVEESKKEITDNINYAQRIQKAMLPSDEYIKNNFPESFIIYRPKDIVSGDFYWAYRDNESTYISCADCTGHGVSGAMMSMIGASLLNEIVIERKITSPEKVLNTLRDEIIRSINQEGAAEERKDGMDISFVKITGIKLECACANNPIYIIRNGQVIDVKANRFPVGKYAGNDSFTLNTIELQKGDTIYTLSDGFVDQFGGDKNKKLMSKRFKEWASELSNLPMADIKEQLEARFNKWIGSTEQTDDVTVVTIKV